MTELSKRIKDKARDVLEPRNLDRVLAAIGAQESHRVRSQVYDDLRDAEFRVFSQFGEDGIIQYLIHHVPIENEVFIEFGVQDYSESNTRFLLVNDNWRGLIFDIGDDHLDFVASDPMIWRHWIDARSARITKENVNSTFAEAGVTGDIGLLSIDIDGNDLWVFEAVDVVSPRIVVVEYNSAFGPERAVSIPYEPDFDRTAAHHSNLYWGASLAGLTHVAEKKGYDLVGSNSAGNNAFFVRKDVRGSLPSPTAREAWVASRFRESRDDAGRATYVGDHEQRIALIADMPLVNVLDGSYTTVAGG